jgi:hypothetical protein
METEDGIRSAVSQLNGIRFQGNVIAVSKEKNKGAWVN